MATALTTLEARQLMAAGPLGIDLASNMGYVDLMKETRPWTSLTSTPVATDAEGWPLADAQIVVFDERVNQPFNGPDPTAVAPDIGGTYHLSFQGKATIGPEYFQQNYYVQNQVYNTATNTTTADLIVYHNTDAVLTIDFSNTVNPASSTGAGVANVKLIQPGYDANTTQLFTNNMINALAPFSTIRYLNVDGANSSTYGPTYDATYQTYSTSSFAVTAGSHQITFQGLNSSGDATAFLDNITVVADAINPNAVVLGNPVAVGDAGFETPALNSGDFVTDPTGTPWTFTGSSGISANASAYTNSNPNAPEGQQVAILQNQGAFSQLVTGFSAANYHLEFSAMQRNGYSAQTIQVLVDGKVVGTIVPPVGKLTALNWADRKLPTDASQSSGPGAAGESWEYMIALANATNTDMWINIPGPATDDYIKQLATLIKNGDTVNGVTYAGLKPNLKVNLEYSNEVWGGIYSNFLYNIAASGAAIASGDTALTSDGINNSYEWAQRYYAQRTMQATTIFRSVLGADPTFAKIRPMLGAQEGSFSYFTQLLPWFESNYGAPSQYFYGIGGANYAFPTDYSSVDNLIASLYANLPQQAITSAQFTTVANYYGLKNIAYEGGVNSGGSPTFDGAQAALAASRDPRMEDYLTQLYSTWYANGGDIAAVFDGPFDSVSPYNQFAIAELAQLADPASSPKYRALVDLSQAAPQTVTAGYAVSQATTATLNVASDTLGASFAAPTAGQTNDWLLNVATAGIYNLVLKTGPGSAGGKITVSLGDQNTVGTYTLGSSGTYNVMLTLQAGLNTLAIATVSPFTATSLTVGGIPLAVKDAGFEDDPLAAGPNGFVYNPTGTAWTFTGYAGLTANNSNFSSGNPVAPEGTQVAFLQNQGSISQSLVVPTAGNYQISFQAAERANFGGVQSFQVLVDGKLVSTFMPTSTSYKSFTSISFVVTAGTHTITFQGLTPNNSDATDFIDAVAIAAAPTSSGIADSGFEEFPQAPGLYGYTYNPQGTDWTFAGASGLTGNNNNFTSGNPVAPEGTQVAFLQNLGNISQSINVSTAGNFQLSFLAAQRGNFGTTQSFQVLIDGKSVGTFSTTSLAYKAFTTSSFALATGTHSIAFQGLNATGDATAFLDAVTIAPVTAAPAVQGTPVTPPAATSGGPPIAVSSQPIATTVAPGTFGSVDATGSAVVIARSTPGAGSTSTLRTRSNRVQQTKLKADGTLV